MKRSANSGTQSHPRTAVYSNPIRVCINLSALDIPGVKPQKALTEPTIK